MSKLSEVGKTFGKTAIFASLLAVGSDIFCSIGTPFTRRLRRRIKDELQLFVVMDNDFEKGTKLQDRQDRERSRRGE